MLEIEINCFAQVHNGRGRYGIRRVLHPSWQCLGLVEKSCEDLLLENKVPPADGRPNQAASVKVPLVVLNNLSLALPFNNSQYARQMYAHSFARVSPIRLLPS